METKYPFPVGTVTLVSFEDFCDFIGIDDVEDARMAMQNSDVSFGTNDDTLVTPVNFMNEMIDAGLMTEQERDGILEETNHIPGIGDLYISLGC